MTSRQHLAPRSLRTAARTAAALASAGAALLLLLTFTVPSFTPDAAARWCALASSAVLLGLSAVELQAPERLPHWFWATVPTQGLLIVVVMDLLTHDASASAQMFLIWPVLYGAYELRQRVAVAALVQVLVADLVVVRAEPVDRAVTDLLTVGVTLSVLCLLLVRARESEARVVRQLERRAATDPLTGLATRRVLDEAAGAALQRPGRDSTLVLVDVDHFKQVNDELGHPAGDAVLVHVAGLLRAQFPAHALVARLGGDELAVLLQTASATEGAERAEAFRVRLLDDPPHVQDRPVRVTVSVGVSTAHDGPPAHLYTAADEALYRAKRSGRNRVEAGGSRPAPEQAGPRATSRP